MELKMNQKRVGCIKHCVYGDCNSDSRPGRPGFKANLRFFPFPKPCLSLRKQDINCKSIRTKHISKCTVCKNCDIWVKSCRRSDMKFSSIANITKDTYICSEHFPGTIDRVQDLPLPLTSSKIKEMEIKDTSSKKRSLDEKYVLREIQNKKFKLMKVNEDNDNIENQENLNPIQIMSNELVEQSSDETTNKINSEMEKANVLNEVSKRTISTQTTFSYVDEISLKTKITELHEKLRNLKSDMKKEDSMIIFEKKIKENDKMCLFYTGFVFTQLVMVLKFISCENITYWGCNQKKNKSRLRKYTHIQELILTLVRLRGGLLVKDVAYRFNVSTGFVTNIFTTWIQLMYNKFSTLRSSMFSSREQIQEHLPACFSKLKNVRVILDCAEVFCETPSNFEQQGNLYSHYKAHTTFKVLIGCTPNGAVSFISDLFEGSISDRQIVEKSGILDLLAPGDIVLADRGFTIKDLTDARKAGLNIPPFLRGRTKLTAAEEVETKVIARNRIYIEHVVGRIKQYRLLKKIIPMSMRGIISQAVFVCGCLLNFQKPILEK